MSHLYAKFAERGWLYSLAILFNRVVPERLFRFRYFHVYRLDSFSIEASGQLASRNIVVHRCSRADEIKIASEITGWQPRCSPGIPGRPAPALDQPDPVLNQPDPALDQPDRALDQPDRALDQPGRALDQPARIAYLASVDQRAVGAVWVATGEFDEPELGLLYRLRDDQCWLFSARVKKECRRMGIYERMLAQAIDGAGSATLLAAINPLNVASMAAHRKSFSRGHESIPRGDHPSQHAPVGRCLAMRVSNVSLAWCWGGLSVDRHATLDRRERPIRIEVTSEFVG